MQRSTCRQEEIPNSKPRSVLASVDPQKIVGRWHAGGTDLVPGPFGLFTPFDRRNVLLLRFTRETQFSQPSTREK